MAGVSAAENGEQNKPRGQRASAGGSDLAAWYRQKADECVKLAAEAPDEEMRDQWLKLANGWSQLAMHMKR